MFDFDEYQKQAMRTRSGHAEVGEPAMLNAALGMGGEAGEVLDLVKKIRFHGHPLTLEIRDRLLKETGDLLWYCALMAWALDTPLSHVALQNIAKLRKRYPDGFSIERSMNREEYETQYLNGFPLDAPSDT